MPQFLEVLWLPFMIHGLPIDQVDFLITIPHEIFTAVFHYTCITPLRVITHLHSISIYTVDIFERIPTTAIFVFSSIIRH